MNKLIEALDRIKILTRFKPSKMDINSILYQINESATEAQQALSEHAANKEDHVELKSRMRVEGSFKRMQPVLNKESGMLSISKEELIKELEDKRLCKFSNLDETMYSLSLKHTAEHLLDKFLITPLSTSPK